jgi:hypothetical protein
VGYYMAGDYYAAGGILGNIWGGIKGAVGGFVKGGVTGAIGGAIGGAVGKKKGGVLSYVQPPTIMQPKPGIVGAIERIVPGGETGMVAVTATGERKRPRMNVANPKALWRAIRREAGFVKLAKRALRGTAYTITTKGRSRRPVSIREAGPGSVVVR